MSVYLDFNASTPIDPRVLDVMVDVYKNKYGNADSRTHDYGENARKVVDNSRQQIANLLETKKDEIFFTSGATESDNIAILGLEKYANKTGKKHIVTTAIEHKAVLLPINHLESKGFEVSYIQPDVNGRIDAQKLLSEVRNDTLLVSVMHSNNETGVIQPVDEIGEELSKKDILFHIDAAQSCGKLVEELQNIKYNMLSASAHKMYGPQGVGLLVLRKKCYKSPPVSSIMFGGSQEHGLRPGTIPTALIAGFGKAAELALQEYKFKTQSYLKTKNEILQLLESSGVAYKINGDISHSMPNTLNVSFKGINSEALMLATKQYCSVSNGSACNSSSYNPSHVLTAMGLNIEDIESSIRLSWGNNDNIITNLELLIQTAKKL